MSEIRTGRPAQPVATSPPRAVSGDGSQRVGGAPAPDLDVLVIGVGQAGLATAYQLLATVLRYAVVDRHSRVGDSWRKRYDSLVLFTPRSYRPLAGLAVAGDPKGYPTKDEIADYLEPYATHFALPIRLNVEVRSLDRADGKFRVTATVRNRRDRRDTTATLVAPHAQRLVGHLTPAPHRASPSGGPTRSIDPTQRVKRG